MPIYSNKCTECGKQDEYIRSVPDRDATPICRECGAETYRVMTFTGTVWAPSAGGYR